MERSAESTIQSSTPPTTFVQTNPETFRDVVQKLTGADSDVDQTEMLPMTPVAKPVMVGPRRQPFKLHDRRPSIRKLEIKLGYTSLHSPRSSTISPNPFFPPSPSSPHYQLRDYHILSNGSSPSSVSLAPPKVPPFSSPVSPLVANDSLSVDVSEEMKKAAASASASASASATTTRDWKFYLRPSTRRSGPPKLLTLFPLSSPKSSVPNPDE